MADTEKKTETDIKTETETDIKTETEAAPKPKSTVKAKAAPKPKSTAKAKAAPKPKSTAKAKAKPKAKAKAKTASKTNTADVAHYQSKGNKAASSQAQKPKQKFSTTLLLIAIFAIVVIITTYKLNIQMSELSAQSDTQKNTVNAEPDNLSAQVKTMDITAAPAAETQAEPANIKEASAVTEAPKQDAPPANQSPLKQAGTPALTQTQTRSATHYESLQQRRQEFEKRMQLKKQEYETIVETHKQERAKLAAEQNNLMLRSRQNNEETKLKVDEIRQQINDLYQQINQIMRESSQVQRQP